jgi:hypothetical protein
VPPVSDTRDRDVPEAQPLAFGGFAGDVDISDFDPIVAPHAMRR